jgi:hypothetical protein
MARMPAADRRHLLLVSLRHIRRQYPKYAKQINGIATLIVKGKAPQSSLLSTVNVLLGGDELRKVLALVVEAFVAFKIRKRAFENGATLCHGCFSYSSVVTCETCGHMAFCYGCLDYGACDFCSSRAKVKEDSPPGEEEICVMCSEA